MLSPQPRRGNSRLGWHPNDLIFGCDCPERPNPDAIARADWRAEWAALSGRYLDALGGDLLRESVPPLPWKPEEVARLAATALHPTYRPLLAHVLALVLVEVLQAQRDLLAPALLELLTDDITDIALAVQKEVGDE